MFRRALAVMVSGMLWASALGSQPARAQEAARSAERARAEVQRIGVSQKARVEVRLRDGTRLKGYVSTAADDTFVVTEQKTGAIRTVAYADVVRVTKSGGGLSAKGWVLIAAAAAAAAVVGVTVIGPAACDGGAGC